jgi:hypothetical protein
VILENELAKAKAKGKAVRNSKMDEIKLMKRDLDNKKNYNETFRREE